MSAPVVSAPVVYVVGPTGVGKSAVALALAEGIGAEVVNADAFQIYRGLEILTAAPTPAERARVPHHGYGVLDPAEPCDAARGASLARAALAEVAARGVSAVVVGGSGLYVKALTHGLADLPSDASVRAALAARGLAEKVAELKRRDPAGAAVMNLSNERQVDRALEICELTGRPASEVRSGWAAPDPPGLCGVLVTRDRDALYARINERVEAMVAGGVLEELAALRRSDRPVSATAAKAIGFREFGEVLDGNRPLADAVAVVQLATRHYAKRQLTWFRRERWLKTVCLGADETPDSAAASITSALFP